MKTLHVELPNLPEVLSAPHDVMTPRDLLAASSFALDSLLAVEEGITINDAQRAAMTWFASRLAHALRQERPYLASPSQLLN